MYASVRRYHVISGSTDEWMRRVQTGFVPIINQVPGFIAYYAIQVRDDEAIIVNIFDTQAGAEEGIRQAANWVAKNLISLTQGFPDITIGTVRIAQVQNPVMLPQDAAQVQDSVVPTENAAQVQNPVMLRDVSDEQAHVPDDDHGPYYPSTASGTQN
jgi:hypothetical protein